MYKIYLLFISLFVCNNILCSCNHDENHKDTFVTAQSDYKLQAIYGDEVKKLLEVSNAKEVMVITITNMLKSYMPERQASLAAIEAVNGIWPKYMVDCINVYQKYLSLEDVKAWIAFYETQSGKKFALYNLQMVEELSKISEEKYSSYFAEVFSKYVPLGYN